MIPEYVFLPLEESVRQHKGFNTRDLKLHTNWKYNYRPDKELLPVFGTSYSYNYWINLSDTPDYSGKIYFHDGFHLPYYSHHSLAQLLAFFLEAFQSKLFYIDEQGLLDSRIDLWEEDVQRKQAAIAKLGEEPDLKHRNQDLKLLDMLKTDSFCGVKIGFSKEQIVAQLGKPDYIETHEDEGCWFYKDDNLECWYYNSFQFTLENNRLTCMSTKYLGSESPNYTENWLQRKFNSVHWMAPFEPEMPINACKSILDAHAIAYEEKPFFDCLEHSIGENISLYYSSELASHKEHTEWSQYSEAELDWKLWAIFSHQKEAAHPRQVLKLTPE